MADDGMKIDLDDALRRRLNAAAAAAGSPPEVMAAELIRQALDPSWDEDFARIAEYDRTGEFISVEQFVTELREAVDARFSRK